MIFHLSVVVLDRQFCYFKFSFEVETRLLLNAPGKLHAKNLSPQRRQSLHCWLCKVYVCYGSDLHNLSKMVATQNQKLLESPILAHVFSRCCFLVFTQIFFFSEISSASWFIFFPLKICPSVVRRIPVNPYPPQHTMTTSSCSRMIK